MIFLTNLFAFAACPSPKQTRQKTSCMANRQQNGVVNGNALGAFSKLLRLDLWHFFKTDPCTLIQDISVIPGTFYVIEVSYERAGIKLSRNVIIYLKFRYRSPNKFLVSLLHIVFIHSCVKYVSYEWHQMKEEDPGFPNMYHLFIIIVIKIWSSIDESRFRFFFSRTHCSIQSVTSSIESNYILISCRRYFLLIRNGLSLCLQF